jgi:ribonuclease R
VNAFLKNNQSLHNSNLEKALIHANELSQKLQLMRRKRGEIEFESSELGFIVDEAGRVLDVYERVSDVAENLIESLMLVANETVAEHMHFANLPSIYRIHEKPDIEKLRAALLTIKRLGVPVELKKLGNPKALQMMTKQSANSPFSYVVHMTLLRAMQKAIYTSYADLHYGLGARYYTHFTSPIRRYPDLILHRLIHAFVLGETKTYKKDFKHFESILPDVAKQSSDQERKAVQMERDVAKLKSLEYMQDKLEQTFNAMITQMMPSGMFVKLENGIEGFVPLKALNDYYHYNENMLSYIGSRGTVYKLGMTVTVKLMSVDLQSKKMDFNIVHKKQKSKRRKS